MRNTWSDKMSSLNCGQCNQPISCNNGNIDNLKKHIKSEHEVVKYKLELNLAMALLTEKEGEEMVRRIKDRLDGFQETGILDISKNIFLGTGKRSNAGGVVDGLTEKSLNEEVKDIVGIEDHDESLLLEDGVEDLLESNITAVEQDELNFISQILNENLSDNESDDEISIIEEITNKRKSPTKQIKTEIKQEKDNVIELGGTPVFLSPPPTPNPTLTPCPPDPQLETPLGSFLSPSPKDAPTVNVKLEVIGDDEEETEMITESDSSEMFCRLCYHTFYKASEQLTHERKDHNVKEDQDALNFNLTDLTLEDFCHSCEVCGLKFLTNNSIKVHKRDMHKMGLGKLKKKVTAKEDSFSCKLCYKEYKKQSSLKIHKYRDHIGEESKYFGMEITEDLLCHNCNDCELKFVTESLLGKHMTIHLKPMKSSGGYFAKGSRGKVARKRECTLCYKKFKAKQTLEKHVRVVHKNDTGFLGRPIDESELLYHCKNCDFRFVKETILIRHMRIHTLEKYRNFKVGTRFECALCYKRFNDLMHLKRHLEGIHKGDAVLIWQNLDQSNLEYACHICEKKFLKESILEYHKKEHDTEKYRHLRKECYRANANKFQCKFCRKNLKDFPLLIKHTRMKHEQDEHLIESTIQENDCKFQCQSCDEKFISENSKNCHSENAHGGKLKQRTQALTECKLCYRTFKLPCNLKQHIEKGHRNDKEFLNKEIKHSDLKYSCDVCPQKFVTENILKKHSDRHLSDEFSYLKIECFRKDIKRYQCKFCYVKFKKVATFKTFLYHMITEHKTEESLFKIKINPGECQHACTNCNLKFITEDVVKYHEVKTHKKANVVQKRPMSKNPIQNDLKCQLCFAKFETSTKRNLHVYRVHKKIPEEMEALNMAVSGQRISHMFHMKCRYCSKSFLNVHILKFHMSNIHKEQSNNEDWKCQYCGLVIAPNKSRTTMIWKHMRSVHHIASSTTSRGRYSSTALQIVQPEDQTREDGTKKNFDLIMQKLLSGNK